MGAIKKYTNNISEAVLAVQAGNDILLTSDYYKHYDAVVKAAEEGSISIDIIDKACKRIIAYKLKYINFKKEEEEEEEPDYTLLIIVLIILSILLVGAAIFFLIMYFRNKSKGDSEKDLADAALVSDE